MSEFKFACPVCGQHIECASDKSGTPMECPTCFRKIVVPQALSGGSSPLLIRAAQVTTRPPTQVVGAELSAARAGGRRFPVAAVALFLVLGAAAAGAYFFRVELARFAQIQPPAQPPPRALDTNWTLQLAGVKIPDTPAGGRIHGRPFQIQRATLQGGTLSLRQGATWPPDAGVTILLYAKQGEDLAGKIINLETNRVKSPRVILRWKDEQEQPVTQNIREGYALRLEFGKVTGKRMPGRLYFCAPDEERSYVAGTFEAEIRKPTPTKAP